MDPDRDPGKRTRRFEINLNSNAYLAIFAVCAAVVLIVLIVS